MIKMSSTSPGKTVLKYKCSECHFKAEFPDSENARSCCLLCQTPWSSEAAGSEETYTSSQNEESHEQQEGQSLVITDQNRDRSNGYEILNPLNKDTATFQKNPLEHSRFSESASHHQEKSFSRQLSSQVNNAPRREPNQHGRYEVQHTTRRSILPSASFSGLRAPLKNAITVKFHVIVPKHLWEWDSSTTIDIQFGLKNLGYWQNCRLNGEFYESRTTVTLDTWSIMSFTFARFDRRLLEENDIPYKYVISSPRAVKPGDCYEYLHFFNEDFNRCLEWTKSRLIHGVYNQFDTIAFPKLVKESQKGSISAIGDAIGEFLKRRLLPRFDHEELQCKPLAISTVCLTLYLNEIKLKLTAEKLDESFNFQHCFCKINQIFECVFTITGIQFNNFRPQKKVINVKKKLEEVLFEWLENIIPLSCEQSHDKLSVAVFIIFCFGKKFPSIWTTRLKPETIQYLIRMLALYPNFDSRECVEYELLQTQTSKTERNNVCYHVGKLCKTYAGSKSSPDLLCNWFSVLPVYHFLSGKSNPFQAKKTTWISAKTTTETDAIGVCQVQAKVDKETRLLDVYPSLKDLFSFDSQLLMVYIECCQLNIFPQLCQDISPSLCMQWFSYHVEQPDVLQSVPSDKNCSDWCKAIILVETVIEQKKLCDSESVEAALTFCETMFKRLSNCTQESLTILCASSHLMVTTLMKYSPDQLAHNRLRVQQMIKNWIEGKYAIGSKKFGGSSVQGHWQGAKELEVWQQLLSQVPISGTNLIWQDILKKIIQERIQDIKELKKVDLFCKMEYRTEDIHNILAELIIEAALEAISALTKKSEVHGPESVTEIAKIHTARVGELFGKILKNHFHVNEETDVTEVNTTDLLTWSLWPNFIRIIVGDRAREVFLKSECCAICVLAQTRLQQLCTELLDGTITIANVKAIYQHKKQMDQLCKEIHLNKSRSLKIAIDERLGEYKTFEKCLKQLRHLREQIEVDLISMSDLENILAKNYEDCQIRSVCQRSGGKIVLTCFKPLGKLVQCLKQFYDMSCTYHTTVFCTKWRNQLLHAFTENRALSFDHIYSSVWMHCFKHFLAMLEKLSTLQMKLTDVDEYFSECKESLDTVLQNLYKGVHQCSDKEVPETIRIAGDKCKRYWKLCQNCDVAKVVLQLRDFLRLTGDFSLVEKLSLQASSKQEILANIDDSTIQAETFLQEIASDQEGKLASLSILLESRKLVDWLQSISTDISQLQNFVNMAMATTTIADDAVCDKLSILRTVGGALGSLIYNLPSSEGYETLCKRCKLLWKALNNNKNLPMQLKTCTEYLESFKNIREMQGSVETTAYGQLHKLLRHGQYRIGTTRHGEISSINTLITVTVSFLDKNGHKFEQGYNLDELRDLESKLVLIAGNRPEYRQEVDLFLNVLHIITRIAEVLVELRQVGNIKYSVWVLQFVCAVYQGNVHDVKVEVMFIDKLAEKLVFQLQHCVQVMEEELTEWKCVVEGARREFYELNSFTTIQLHHLRNDLGKQKRCNNGYLMKPDTLTVLQCISPDVTQISIQRFVHCVVKRSSNKTQSHSGARKAQKDAQNTFAQKSGENLDLIVDSSENSSEEVLSPDQKSIITTLRNTNFYPTSLILQAFKELGSTTCFTEIKNWCENHYVSLEYDQDTENEISTPFFDSDHDDSDSESDESHETNLNNQEQSSISIGSRLQTKTEMLTKSMDIVQKQVIDENHPLVMELVDLKFNLEDSLEAVKLNGSIDMCITYLSKDKEERKQFTLKVDEQKKPEDIMILCNCEAEQRFLSLEELGQVLQQITKELPSPVSTKRTFVTDYSPGNPNLVVVSAEHILQVALSLYMQDPSLPLPSQDEILICTQNTTEEEVTLLWRRAMGDPDFRRIFCLAHADRLSYQVSDKVLRSFGELSQGNTGYRLVIICSKQVEDSSLFVSKFHLYKRPLVLNFDLLLPSLQSYLKNHFVSQPSVCRGNVASQVDIEKSCVRLITSDRAGMGKSLYIKQMAHKLASSLKCSIDEVYVSVPIHGPNVSSESLLNVLTNLSLPEVTCKIIHINISPTVRSEIGVILFQLLILKSVTDNLGRIWRCHPSQYFVVELTLLKKALVSDSKHVRQAREILYLFPIVNCLSPKQADAIRSPKLDVEHFNSARYQRVYQYLQRYMRGEDLDSFTFKEHVINGNRTDCLEKILRNCGIKDPSWSEIHDFVTFLNEQLLCCETSAFCSKGATIIGRGFKTFVVRFMIRMSLDFATASLKGEVAKENEIEEINRDLGIELYQVVKQWENSSHPYIFFNHDQDSLTFVGFRATQLVGNSSWSIVNSKGDLIEKNILTNDLFQLLKVNKVDFNSQWEKLDKRELINRLARVMGITNYSDPDSSYVLTEDNLIKMLAIQMRFRCGIPVILIGETGCGKTRLIRYMCSLGNTDKLQRKMLIIKIHGGITEKHIVSFVQQAEILAKKNAQINAKNNDYTVAFFDEANTTDAIGLIKEIVCDRSVNGRPICSSNLKFVAACNPYRKHSPEMIKRLESAGLGFAVRETDTMEKLGCIPLRQLVYRVLELPPRMRSLVYDFGKLDSQTEYQYIYNIVEHHVTSHTLYSHLPKVNRATQVRFIKSVSDVLSHSQNYMKETKNECSFVSLRDVERAMIVFRYFLTSMKMIAPLINEKARREKPTSLLDNTTRAMVLTISVCYHARLQRRTEYESRIANEFKKPLCLPGKSTQFRNEIKWCQEVYLDAMVIGPNIAKNEALRENVFMMAICIQLRIPLFLIGKPGSSKSLAKSIIQNSMHGTSSTTNLLRSLKQIHMFSYQCSQLSTPDSIIEVFNQANKVQNSSGSNCVSVVVLDEVGLAEDSPSLPLKALHPLLEDGTDSAKTAKDNLFGDVVIPREERVAFVGISNWALDPAKMNRGLMVTRGDPDVDELVLSANGICTKKDRKLSPAEQARDDTVKHRLKEYFKPLAQAYLEICKKQSVNFFGLRDFYSLIKMLYWMCEKSEGKEITWPQLEYSIKRNFGGLKTPQVEPLMIFKRMLQFTDETVNTSEISDNLLEFVNPDCSELGLIKTSLNTAGENRYLLFLTENYVALGILERYLLDVKLSSESHARGAGRDKPLILFGSSFPKDKDYTLICRHINQIKICMETGRTVILLNLDYLYESLYDLLNQNFMYFADSRYVDLGLGIGHRVKCRVHSDFKLILIAEKDTVYKKFPTPLINRLEKHFVLTSTVLNDWQQSILGKFESWIADFCQCTDSIQSGANDVKFSESDAFIGYQKDTPASVVLEASNRIIQLEEQPDDPVTINLIKNCGILDSPGVSIEKLTARKYKSSLFQKAVLQLSQYLILQTSSDDSLIRLKKTALADQQEKLIKMYYRQQLHNSAQEFVEYHLRNHDLSGIGLLLQITTHGQLLSSEEIEVLRDSMSTKLNTAVFLLQEFDTELDFSSKLHSVFQRTDDQELDHLIIIQCDSGHLCSDLIACSRYLIYEERVRTCAEPVCESKRGKTHVLFIINLPCHVIGSSFVSFQGDPWICVHIDELKKKSTVTPDPYEAIHTSISEMFVGQDILQEPSLTGIPSENISMKSVECLEHLPQCARLHGCIQAAVSKLQDNSRHRNSHRVKVLLNLVPQELQVGHLNSAKFFGALVQHVFRLLKERDELWIQDQSWVLNEAMNPKSLQNGGTFRNVLARKIDQVVVPCFAEIIAKIDNYYNLNLIDVKNEQSPLSQFWIAMFRDPEIMQWSYSNMTVQIVPPMSNMEFKCNLPFSWIIKDVIYNQVQWKALLNDNKILIDSQVVLQFCESVEQTPVGEVLKLVNDQDSETFYLKYLKDFVQLTHKCKHKLKNSETDEYKIIEKALDRMVHSSMFATLDGRVTFTQRIVALHMVFNKTRLKIILFSQLVSHHPGIMVQLEKTMNLHPPNNMEMEVQLYAVEALLSKDLSPPIKNVDSVDNLRLWVKHVRLISNTINSILNCPSQSDIARKIRLDWNRICALQLFIEQILLKYPRVEFIHHAQRLDAVLRRDSDFRKFSAINNVRAILNLMKKQPNIELHKLRDDCDKFFLELISNLSFQDQSLPEEQLVEMLMDVVFETSSKYKKKKVFFLRLLMEHDIKNVREKLEKYFHRLDQPLDGKEMNRLLCLLCIQCFEDIWHQKLCTESISRTKQVMESFICEGHDALRTYSQSNSVSLQFIEGVAKLRVSLSYLAEEISTKQDVFTSECSKLIELCKELCLDKSVNSVTVDAPSGPSIYLLKLIVQHYGLPTLNCIAHELPWVIPAELAESKHEMLDPFVIYCEQYTDLRDAVSCAVFLNDRQKLKDEIQLDSQNTALFMLALFEKITLSYADVSKTENFAPEALQNLVSFILSTKCFSPDLKLMAKALMSNQQGNTLAQMCVVPQLSEQCKTLIGVVVHTAAVLYSRKTAQILLPLTNMLNNPVALNNCYLPTMQEDFLEEAGAVLRKSEKSQYKTGKFYECENGHRYFVGNCGNPAVKSNCDVCGCHIGGDGKLIKGNRPVQYRDITKAGHDLGRPQERVFPASERNLSPTSICIMRALMHSAFVWNCCRNESVWESIAHLVHTTPPIRSNELAEFFWKHLEIDIEHLGKATGKGFDESIMIVHLVLKNILTQNNLPGGTLGDLESISLLHTKQEREKWEKIFYQHYIQPLVCNLDPSLSTAMNHIVQDTDTDHSMLLHIAYEKINVREDRTEPHLWIFRSRVTLNHLYRTISENKKIMGKHAILYEFLQMEPILRATKYLPDIIQLQLSLYQRFHYRIDESDAKNNTIKMFLDSIRTNHEKELYQKRIESLKKAWKLVGHQLLNHRRLSLETKFFVPEFTESTPLVYIIPTTSNEGVCTTALVDFLVLAHNNFIERCRGIVKEEQTWVHLLWHSQSVLIAHVQHCHFVDHEQQILSILLSHCEYSLEVGKGHSVQYNYNSLEKNIFNRFIYGKPFVEVSDIPLVLYRKDICTSATFAAIRRKVHPQEPLSSRIQQDIIDELKNNPARISETLDVVDIVLGFLSSGGGRANRNLGDYIVRILRIEPDIQFSEKAKECSLGNILSLWLTLSVERARQFCLNNQSPFESIPKTFLRCLCEGEGGVNQKTELSRCIPAFDGGLLLGYLFELIETYIKYAAEHQADWTVVETIENFDWNITPSFYEKFPKSITLDQAVDAWKYIVNYQQQ